MKQRILIIGAGGFGREVLAWIEDVIAAGKQPDWEIGGFVDANPNALAKFEIDQPIVGDPATYQPQEHDRFVCAIGDPVTKLRLCRAFQQRGAQFVNVMHPTMHVAPRCKLGVGLIFSPMTLISVDTTIGDFVTANPYASIAHDAVIGAGCMLNGFANVNGAVQLGEGVFLGGHAVIAPKVVVGDYARIGAGSAVFHRVKPHSTVVGVPAKRLEFEARSESAKAA